MKTDLADSLFSQWIRLRDRKCLRCSKPGIINSKGLPISHTCSHYFSRGKWSTRFDPDNCIELCYGCHRYLDGHKSEYEVFKIAQLGQDKFDQLTLRAWSPGKKDFMAERLYWKQRLKEDYGGRVI